MKIKALLLGLLFPLVLISQDKQSIIDFYEAEMSTMKHACFNRLMVTNDSLIDIKFYHLFIQPAIDSAYLHANATIGFTSRSEQLTRIKLDLQQSMQVDSIQGSIATYSHDQDSLIIFLQEEMEYGQNAALTIYYQGVPALAANVKGLRYETHDGDILVIASLSTPFLAHYWFPCKDGPYDKADSLFVDILLPKIEYQGFALNAVSNGILDTVIETETSRLYQWRHRYPVVPYYAMVAVSNYMKISQSYCNDEHGHCFPMDYYVFPPDTLEALNGVEEMPEVMALFEQLFGPYPFASEKYGMTQLGFYGAIENQTNTVTNSMSADWLMVSVHELAHMWYGCKLTCSSWNHGWLNEGFATYAEALWKEHSDGSQAYRAHMASIAFYNGGTVYLPDTDDPFGVFLPIIYRKGAWVLHMLRFVMGDEAFFDMLANYSSHESFAYGNLTTDDFRAYCETYHGNSLYWFFDQWVFDAYYPIYYYNFIQTGSQLQLQVFQAQSQLGRRPVFEMPLEWLVEYHDGTDTLIKVYQNEQNQLHLLNGINGEVKSLIADPFQWVLHSSMFQPDLPVGILAENAKTSLQLYPNPVKNLMMIQLPANLNYGFTLQICDFMGRVVKTYHPTAKQELVDVSSWSAGVYLIRLLDNEGQQKDEVKLIKQ
ncbi:MAG: M1 family aminopeptidase [Bacteroidales bacterium]|nr:M1 family aminopeptidase [Bacteroidales bacterium]